MTRRRLSPWPGAPTAPSSHGRPAPRRGRESGFSVMEAVVATVIVTVAIVGIAYSFSDARGLVSRYGDARTALAAAQRRMEMLSVLGASDPALQIGTTHEADVVVDGVVVAHESWTVTAVDDPANGVNPGQADLKRVTVTVTPGTGWPTTQAQLSRLFPAW